MSTTIDEKVVEMRFDNKQFESNVATSMSTLDKLKKSLKFDGASKGLEDINSAAKRVNMDGLGGAVESVKAKFSALDVVAVTALANITNSAVNAGKRMVAALTIDPVKTGFKEYETQINAVQTILANTSSKGTTINDVTAALDELNKYADLTIYNFTEMTRNIGTFTAAGIDLDTSVSAIQGIANLAAVSGSTSQQASTAMYQLSQALSSGTVKLMDWNSVVNAGMGGEVFQNALKETSRLLGTGADAAIEASGSFRESLSDGWLTAEVLTETLKKFTTSGANEYVAEYTGLSADAVQAALDSAEAQYGEAEAIEKASEALAEKSGKNKNEIKSVLQMAKTATEAATKVKTFSQLWDVMKEAAQSGWAKTWQIIIGDFEEAKALLTPLADFFTNIINKMSDWRNDLLESSLGKGFASLGEKINGVLKPATAAADTVEKITDALGDLDEIASKVIRGDFGNGEDRFNALTEAGKNYYRIQNKVNETLGSSFRYSEDQIEAHDKLLGKQEETTEATSETQEETVKLTDAQKDQIKTLAKLSDEELRAKGYTEEQIEAFRELRATAEKLGIPLEKFIDSLDEINGRWLLINSFKNIGQALIKVFSAIGKAWREVFDPIQADQIFDVIAAVHKFTASLIPSEDTVKNLTRTFKGLFAILDIVKTIFGGGLRIALKLVSSILSYFKLDILDVTAAVGDALVNFDNWFKSIFDISGVLDVAVKTVKKWFEAFKETEGVKELVSAVTELVDAIGKMFRGEINVSDFAMSLGSSLARLLASLPKIAIQFGKDFINGFILGLGDGVYSLIKKVIGFCSNFCSAFAEALGIHSPSTISYEYGSNWWQGFINSCKDMYAKVVEAIQPIVDAIKNTLKSLFDYFKDEDGNVDWGKIIGIGSIISLLFILKKLTSAFSIVADGINGINGIMDNASKVLKSLSKTLNSMALSIKLDAIKKTALGIAASVAILVACVWVIASIDDTKKLWSAVGVIAALAIIVVGLALAMAKLADSSIQLNAKTKTLDVKGIQQSILSIGLTLLVLAAAVKIIGDMDPEKAKQGLSGIAGVAAGLVVFLAIMGGISRYSGDAIGVGKMMLKISISLGIMAIVMKTVAKMDPGDIIIGIAVMEAFTLLVIQMGVANRIAGMFGDNFGANVLKISIAIGILVVAMKMISKMDPANIFVGITVLQAFVILIGEMAVINRLAGENISKFGGAVMGMATSMLILIGVIWLLSKMNKDTVENGIKVMQAFVLVIAELVAVSRLAGKESAKISGNILAMATAIGILAGVAMMLSLIDAKSLRKGIAAVAALGLVMSMMIYTTKGTQDVKGNLITLVVAIGVLTAAVVGLSFIGGVKLAGAVAALDSLMLCFALMILMTSKAKNTKNMRKTLLLMIGIVSLLAGLVAFLSLVDPKRAVPNTVALSVLMISFASAIRILNGVKLSKTVINNLQYMVLVIVEIAAILSLMSFLPNPANTIPSAIAIGVLLNALASSIFIMSKAKGNFKMTLAQLQSMALVITEIAAILSLMSFLPNPANTIPSAIAIGILLNTLATSILIMSKAKGNFKMTFVQLQSMALVIAEIAAILSLMSFLPNPVNMIPSAIAIGILLNALATAMLIASFSGKNAAGAASAMVTMSIALAVVGVVLGLMSLFDIGPSIETAISMSILMLALSEACSIVSGINSEMAIDGALGLAAFIGIMAAVITAAGLLSKIPGFNELLADGGVTLGLVGTAIGNFVGGIVGGIITGIGSAVIGLLPQLGLALSSFMVGVQPFIMLASNVDSSVIAGAGYLTAAILCLTVASFISGIAQLMGGGVSFEDLGSKLVLFGSGAMVFINMIKGVDATAIEAASNIADMVLVLTKSELISSITEKFGGSVDFSTMGENLKTFGEAVVGFSETISGKIDVAAVEAATNAGLLLVELNKSLPHSGGWVQDIIGEQDFEKFANACKAFAECILGINEVVSQEGFSIQSEKIEQLVTAGTQFNDLNKALPKTGGIAQDFAGEQDLAGFGAACIAFATCMIGINAAVSGDKFVVQSDKISQLVTAGTQFNDLNKALPKTGGIAQDFAGEQDLARFGASVAAFAGCMILVNQAISGDSFSVNLEGMEDLKQAGMKMEELQSILPKSGGWWQNIAGEQDIGDFGSKIKTFSDAIVGFSTSAAGLNNSGVNFAITTAYRIKNLVASLSDLDTSGLAEFTGIGTGGFGADGAAYEIAQTIAEFSNKVAGINTEAVSVSVWAAQRLKTLINSLTSLDTSGIENFKPQTIGSVMKGYVDKVADIDTGVVSSSITSANRLKNFIASLSGLDSSGVSPFKSAINDLSGANISAFVKAFSGASSKLASVGADMITSLIKGTQSKLPAVKSSIISVLSDAIDVVKTTVSKFESAGGVMMTRMAGGMISKKWSVSSAITSCLSGAVTKIRTYYASFYSAGSYLADGLANGISSNDYKAAAKAKAMAEAAEKAAREALKINSPSKVFKEIGSGIPEGFAMGIRMLGGDVKQSVTEMTSTAIKSTRSTMGTILDALSADMDAQPTIRPVIDLTDVQTGANALNSMFNGVQTIGVRSNLNAINSAINAKLQNGSNDDIISAIDKLRDGLETNRGDVYNFGDFTYDDGDNISDAVRTLVRAAKMGRRV